MSSRFSLSLGTRIFLISGGLLLLALGSAVTLTTALGNRIGTRAAKDRILATNSVQAAFQQQRYEQLGLLAQNLAGNPDFKAYMLQAMDEHNAASILDQLGERQGDLHYDFAAIVDPHGLLVARTDAPNAPPGTSLAQRPLVAKAIAEYQASGVWQEGNRLYYAVAVPLSTGTNHVDLSTLPPGVLAIRVRFDLAGSGSETPYVRSWRVSYTTTTRAPAACPWSTRTGSPACAWPAGSRG